MSTARPGRPRESRVDQAIAAAVPAVLAEVGYRRLTVDAVAARAGVGKAAIYRRHPTKQEMVFAAVVHDTRIDPPPDSGSLRGDLAALAHAIVDSLTRPAAGTVLGLLADVLTDPGLARRFAETYLAAERACIDEVLRRAVERGELPRTPEVARVHALLLGPVFAWVFQLQQSDPHGFADELAELLVSALTADR
ncbi:MAG: TetR/AcrR family transcriptional regulator [Micromonosporaceae bacterium]